MRSQYQRARQVVVDALRIARVPSRIFWSATAVAVALLVSAVVIDPAGGVVNTLTEGVGVVIGTYLAVVIIDSNAKRRNAELQKDRWHRRLADEFSTNLSTMTTRHRNTVFPDYLWFKRDRESIVLALDDYQRPIVLSENQADSLLMWGVAALLRRRALRTDATIAAVAEGVFLLPDGSGLLESPIHARLRECRDLLDRFGIVYLTQLLWPPILDLVEVHRIRKLPFRVPRPPASGRFGGSVQRQSSRSGTSSCAASWSLPCHSPTLTSPP